MADVTGASEIKKLADDMVKAGGRALIEVRAVVAKGALNIKNDLRDQANASGIHEAQALARAISYDTKMTARKGITAEIGPREGGAGSFAFLYFGNSKNGPVLPDPGDALMREAPAMEKFISEVLGKL